MIKIRRLARLLLLGSVVTVVIFSGCNKEDGDVSCYIRQPQEQDTFRFGSTVPIVVEADYSKGIIVETNFFIDGEKVGVSDEFPYSYFFVTGDLEIGWHTIRVVPKTNNGLTLMNERHFYLDDKVTEAKIKNNDIVLLKNRVSITLSANAVENSFEKGCWTVSKGEGGSFADSTKANTVFTGKFGETYTLRWTISNKYYSDFDEIKVILIKIEYGRVIDVDGNIYKTVKIGNQEWMTENLKVTHYPDGSNINLVTIDGAWNNLQYNDSAYCFYDNNENSEYGALYTYTAAINACPDGWHLPSQAEWEELEDYLSDNNYREQEGEVLKSITGWDDDGNGIDLYDFTALPGGFREIYGNYINMYKVGFWWTATECNTTISYSINLQYNNSSLQHRIDYKAYGFSVRCVRDN